MAHPGNNMYAMFENKFLNNINGRSTWKLGKIS
jgi:hypothetical protein